MPKDLDGLGYVDLADSGWKRKLAVELDAAGCDVGFWSATIEGLD